MPHRSYNSIPATAGHKEMVRYADDFVVLCHSEQEARQALEKINTNSGNAIRGIAADNRLGKTYLATSNTYFGLAHTSALQVSGSSIS
jgi:hypothetical protein